jgi:hypothetical protein
MQLNGPLFPAFSPSEGEKEESRRKASGAFKCPILLLTAETARETEFGIELI